MINNRDNSQAEAPSRPTGGGILRTILGNLASAKLAAAVGSLIVLACILGTILPQGTDVPKYIGANPNSASLLKVLGSLGLTNVFDAWWFIVLLTFFACNITACLVRRLSARLKTGHLGISGWGFLLTHMSMLLILAGAVIRGAVGQQGDLEMRAGQSRAEFLTSRGPVKMPFDVHLVKFDLEYYDNKTVEAPPAGEPDTLSIVWPDRSIQTQLVVAVDAPVMIHPSDEAPTGSNAVRVVVSRYVPDFIIDMTTHEVSTRSEDPKNPAILVGIEGPNLQISKWLFANHPDFDMLHAASTNETASKPTLRYHSAGGAQLRNVQDHAKRIRSFKSTLQLLENGKVVREKTIEVNAPLSYRGYTLYQSGYNPEDLTGSTLQVVRDPGVPVVYTGFLCMIGGLILLLCFKPAARQPSPGKQSSDTEA
ncbi:MAG: cytochrome c biogenesis protein ResB [Kiritimatiellota bacterium]|nr:cytochrome c biogenesis protein ResB [Kiritimatiellota bacterium]